MGALFGSIGLSTVCWWLFLWAVWLTHKRLVRCDGITTFSIFLPYVFVTNGVLVPLSNQIAYELTGLDLTLSSYDDYWWSLGLMYLSLLLGIAIANRFRPKTDARPDFSAAREIGNPPAVRLYIAAVLAICGLSLALIYSSGLSFDFLSFASMRMDQDMYAAHRYGFAEATHGFEFSLFNKLPYGIAPVAIILVSNAESITRWKRVAFIAILALTIIQTGHKMPIVFLIASVMASRSLVRREFRLSGKTILIGLSLVLAVVFVVLPGFYLMQGNDTYSDSLFWSVQRLFLEQSRVLQLHFEVYPNIHPFLHGASTGTIASLMGVTDYVPPSVYIPVDVYGLENTSYPALFIGEGWADFGYIGVLLTSTLVGFMLQLYNIWFYGQRRPQLEETATFLAVTFSAYHLLECNLLTSLFSYGMLSCFVIYLMIRRRRAPVLGGRAWPIPAASETETG